MKVRNTFIIFIVSGFWHGANWTFIIWGALNAIYFLPLLLTENNRNNLDIVARGRYLPSLKDSLYILITFGLTVFAWIFFRADNVGHAIRYISEIFSPSLVSIPKFDGIGKAAMTILLILIFVLIEWIGRERQYAIAHLEVNWKKPIRWSFYFILIFTIYFFGNFSESIEFIYFQF